jgi:glutathione S-transferase
MSPFMPWVGVVTLVSLILYLSMSVNVARARARSGIAAPSMVGHPELERAVRVQMNTLEWLPIYLPALWLFGVYVEPRVAAALGAVWILGRALYMTSYMRDPARRGPGFLVQAAATIVLVVGALGGAALKLVAVGG